MAGQAKKPGKKGGGKGQKATVPTPPRIKPEEAFYVAEWYRFSAHRLWERFDVYLPPVAGSGFMLLDEFPPTGVPGMILECLSSEIFLKCLIQIESGSPPPMRTHNLVDLFNLLSQGARDRIRRIFDSKDPPNNDPNQWIFDDVLRTLDRAFVSWRYPYEYGMGTTIFDTRLAISIKEVILELRPDWGHLVAFRVSATFRSH